MTLTDLCRSTIPWSWKSRAGVFPTLLRFGVVLSFGDRVSPNGCCGTYTSCLRQRFLEAGGVSATFPGVAEPLPGVTGTSEETFDEFETLVFSERCGDGSSILSRSAGMGGLWAGRCKTLSWIVLSSSSL